MAHTTAPAATSSAPTGTPNRRHVASVPPRPGVSTADAACAPAPVRPCASTRTVSTAPDGTALSGTVPPLGVVSMSSVAIRSEAVCGRSAGRFSRHFMTTCASSGGMPGRREVTGSGIAASCAPSMAWGERPWNGVCPVSISYPMIPYA
jgi:hypothetical protein